MILYNLLLILARILVIPVSWFSAKLRLNLKIRGGDNAGFLRGEAGAEFENRRRGKKVIWFHAASVGEFEQAKALAREISRRYPDAIRVMSVYSYSAWKQCAGEPLADYFFAMPFDFPGSMKRLLDRLKPDLIVYSRYDVWANLARLAGKRGIPQILISASLHRKSGRSNFLVRSFFTGTYRFLTMIHAINAGHEKNFRAFGLNVMNSGDTRFDAMVHRLNQLPPELKRRFSGFRRKKSVILVAGSTYPASEKFLSQLTLQHPDLQIILAPHHVNEAHNQALRQNFAEVKETRFYSQLPSRGKIPPCRVLIIDTMGILPYLYSFGDIAYVGGGFQGSVHSVLEPACYGLPILTGPAIDTSQEARDLRERDFLTVMNRPDAVEAEAFLRRYWAAAARKKTAAAIRKFFRERTGASARILAHLRTLKIF